MDVHSILHSKWAKIRKNSLILPCCRALFASKAKFNFFLKIGILAFEVIIVIVQGTSKNMSNCPIFPFLADCTNDYDRENRVFP